jgi:hypothetical protein
LRRWFLELDQDRSGEVSYNELVDPLLSSGLFKSQDDVRQLIRLADTDGSGEINFQEFLTALSKDKICDQSKIVTLQNITTKSNVGLSTAMKLSEERRKHLLGTVIDEATKRQEEIDQLYSLYNSSSRPIRHRPQLHPLPLPPPAAPSLHSPSSNSSLSTLPSHQATASTVPLLPSPLRIPKNCKKHKPSPAKQFEMKLEKVALSHHKQVMKSSQYLHSLEPIVSSHKTTIASDNVLDTTETRDLYHTSIHTVMADPELDVGYKDGVHGRRESLARLKKISLRQFGEGTSYQLRRGDDGEGRRRRGYINEEEEEDEEDYSRYDSHYTVYSPIEVTATSAAPSHAPAPSSRQKQHHSHQTAHPPLLHSSSSGRKGVPMLPSLASQRCSQSHLRGEDVNSSARCPSGRVTLRRQPSSSRHLEDVPTHSPLPTGRAGKPSHLQKSNSQAFFKQSSFNLSQAGGNVRGVGGLPPLLSQRQGSDEFTDPKRRRRSVVKRFYRKASAQEEDE